MARENHRSLLLDRLRSYKTDHEKNTKAHDFEFDVFLHGEKKFPMSLSGNIKIEEHPSGTLSSPCKRCAQSIIILPNGQFVGSGLKDTCPKLV